MEEKTLDIEQVFGFLEEVDECFPVPLSMKTDLRELAQKLLKYGTICAKQIDGRIVSMVAGYTEHTVAGLGYISVVATLTEETGKGYIKDLLKQFIAKASTRNLHGVNLYCHPSNVKALHMYERLGFVVWKPENEPRKSDVHLLYVIKGDDENDIHNTNHTNP